MSGTFLDERELRPFLLPVLVGPFVASCSSSGRGGGAPDFLDVVLLLGGCVVGLFWIHRAQSKAVLRYQEKEAERVLAAERAAREEKAEHERREAERRRRQDAAQALADACRGAVAHFERIPNELLAAEAHIDTADAEFRDRVFAPFWDCVELAFKALGSAKASVVAIRVAARSYATAATAVAGNVPSFPIPQLAVEKLTAISSTERRLNAVIRRAQADPDFAKIYEMRRMNKQMEVGFPTLADAIRDSASTISSSLDQLRYDLSDLATDARDHRSNVEDSLRSAIEMLDNIQNRRKPKPS